MFIIHDKVMRAALRRWSSRSARRARTAAPCRSHLQAWLSNAGRETFVRAVEAVVDAVADVGRMYAESPVAAGEPRLGALSGEWDVVDARTVLGRGVVARRVAATRDDGSAARRSRRRSRARRRTPTSAPDSARPTRRGTRRDGTRDAPPMRWPSSTARRARRRVSAFVCGATFYECHR